MNRKSWAVILAASVQQGHHYVQMPIRPNLCRCNLLRHETNWLQPLRDLFWTLALDLLVSCSDCMPHTFTLDYCDFRLNQFDLPFAAPTLLMLQYFTSNFRVLDPAFHPPSLLSSKCTVSEYSVRLSWSALFFSLFTFIPIPLLNPPSTMPAHKTRSTATCTCQCHPVSSQSRSTVRTER